MSPTGRLPASPARSARVIRYLSLAGVLVVAAGCTSPRLRDETHPLVTDPSKRHAIVVAAETPMLDLPVAAGDTGGEARAFIETTRFVRQYRQDAKGPLIAAVPSPRHQSHAVADRMRKLRLVMAREGVPPHRLQVRAAASGHLITLSYDRIAAVPPTCGDWSDDVTRNPENIPYPNYGCASQRNLAVMLANPTDAAFPTREVERQSDRRATAYKNFTSTAPAAAGTTSSTGK